MSNEEKYRKTLERILYLCGPQEEHDKEERAEKYSCPEKLITNSGVCQACFVEAQGSSCWVPKIKSIVEDVLNANDHLQTKDQL